MGMMNHNYRDKQSEIDNKKRKNEERLREV